MEQLIVNNSGAISVVIATVLGWALARLKDVIDLKVKASKNGWDDAVWEAVKKTLPKE